MKTSIDTQRVKKIERGREKKREEERKKERKNEREREVTKY